MVDLDVREQIVRFAQGKGTAAELEDQLEDASWASADDPDPAVEASLRLLAEHANGDWTDAELAERLLAFAETYALHAAPVSAVGASAAQLILEDRQSAPAERRLVEEPV